MLRKRVSVSENMICLIVSSKKKIYISETIEPIKNEPYRFPIKSSVSLNKYVLSFVIYENL